MYCLNLVQVCQLGINRCLKDVEFQNVLNRKFFKTSQKEQSTSDYTYLYECTPHYSQKSLGNLVLFLYSKLATVEVLL